MMQFRPLLNDSDWPRVVRTFRLTGREGECAWWACRGLSNAEISARLGIDRDTVKQHLSSCFRKMQVVSRVELLLRVLETWRGQPRDMPISDSDAIMPSAAMTASAASVVPRN